MRIFPLLMAILVAVILYFAIIDRETAREFLGLSETGQSETGQSENEQMTHQAQAFRTDPDAQPVEETNLIKVVVQRSKAQKVNSAVILRGQTEAARQVEVRAETSSTVISPPLPKGTFVKEGELLCRLDPGTRVASVDEAKARLSEAKARLLEARSRVPEAKARVTEAMARLEEAITNQKAAQKLSEDGFASDTRVKGADAAAAAAQAGVQAAKTGLTSTTAGIQTAEAGIESATAAVAAAQKELSRLEITAPFSGLLESNTAELGSLLQPGSLCATVIQLDPVKLVAFAPETEVNRIKTGAIATARLATGGSGVRGFVTFVSRAADPTTRTFRVEMDVANPDLSIRDGQTAEIIIGADGALAHLLPQSALTLNNEGILGLRVLDAENIVRFQPVDLLRDSAEGVWLAGLPDAMDVIVIGQEYVTEGVKVAPAFRESTK